jgi:hypothetical protein
VRYLEAFHLEKYSFHTWIKADEFQWELFLQHIRNRESKYSKEDIFHGTEFNGIDLLNSR